MSFFKLEFAKSITNSFKELEKRETNTQKSYQKIQQKLNYRSGKDVAGMKEKSFFDVLISKSGPELIYSYLNQRIRQIQVLRTQNSAVQYSSLSQNQQIQNQLMNKGNTIREFQPNPKSSQTIFNSQEQPQSQQQQTQQQQTQQQQQQQLTTYHNDNQELNIENIELDEYKLIVLMREVLVDCSEITATDIIDLFEAKPHQKVGFQELYLIIVYVASIESGQQQEYLNLFGQLLFTITKSTPTAIYGSRIRQVSKLFGFPEKRICKVFRSLNIAPQTLYPFDIFELYFFMLFSEIQQNQGYMLSSFSSQNNSLMNKHMSIPNSPQKMNFPQSYVPQQGMGMQQQLYQAQLMQQQQIYNSNQSTSNKLQQNQNCSIF